MREHDLHDSAQFWCAMGGAIAVIGGVLLGVGVARSGKSSVWSQEWFDAGFAVTMLGALALCWALVLYVANRQTTNDGISYVPPEPIPQRSSDAAPASILRNEQGLRELRPLEEGLPISALPPGVYGFTTPWSVSRLPSADLCAHAGGTAVLEVHKAQSGDVELVGYVSQETAARIADEGAILLFPEPWEEAKTLVTIPLARIISADSGHFGLGYKIEAQLGPRAQGARS
jgi:hypothetical protein